LHYFIWKQTEMSDHPGCDVVCPAKTSVQTGVLSEIDAKLDQFSAIWT